MKIVNSNSITNYAIALSIVVPLAGCASTSPPPQLYFGTTSIINIPEINVQTTAEIGQNIISKANLTKIPAITISSNVSEVVNSPGITTIQAGSIPLFTSNEHGKFYRDSNATYTMLGATVPSNDRSGIYVPNDKTQPPVIYHYTSSYAYGEIPVPNIQYTTIEKWGTDSFKRELVYSGISQNTITILYREFSENIARPAFSQELKYDLSQGNAIGYKGARLEVIKATNTELVYKIIKPLD